MLFGMLSRVGPGNMYYMEMYMPRREGAFLGVWSGLFREISAKSGIFKNTPRNFYIFPRREICCALVVGSRVES